MVLKAITSDLVGIGTQVGLGSTDDAYIAAGVTVASTDSWAITSSGDNQSVNVQGAVIGAKSAVDLGSVNGQGQYLTVGEQGYVGSSSQMVAAVVMRGSTALIDNAGTIHGDGSAVEIRGPAGGNAAIIDNSGLIEGTWNTIYRDSSIANNEEGVYLFNTGVLRNPFGISVYDGGASSVAFDYIYNTGLIVGWVELGAGNDIYDGTGGRLAISSATSTTARTSWCSITPRSAAWARRAA